MKNLPTTVNEIAEQQPTPNDWRKGRTSLSIVLLLENYILFCIFKALFILRPVLRVSQIVCTVAHVPRTMLVSRPKTDVQVSDLSSTVIQHLNEGMEFTSDRTCTSPAPWCDLGRALRKSACLLHWATVNVGAKTSSLETGLLGLALTINENTAPSFMECVMAAHTVTKASEYMAGNVAGSDSDAPDSKLQPPRNGSQLLNCGSTWEARSSKPRLLLVSWRKQTLRRKSKVAWPNGPICHSYLSSRLSLPHSRTPYKQDISIQWPQVRYVQRRRTSPRRNEPIRSGPYSTPDGDEQTHLKNL